MEALVVSSESAAVMARVGDDLGDELRERLAERGALKQIEGMLRHVDEGL